jgi:hypothetical protein
MLECSAARRRHGTADFAESDAFHLMQRGLETLDRFAKVFGAETERLMMDRHDEMSAKSLSRKN